MLRETGDTRVIIVDGYGVALTVRSGRVVIRDGQGQHKRERKLARLDAKHAGGIARIVILADTGYVSLEVLRWARALSISIVQADRTGNLVMCSPGLPVDARMRRSQVLAMPDMPSATTGLDITRELETAKLAGQAETLRYMRLPCDDIMKWSAKLTAAKDLAAILAAEGNAATAYWAAWANRVFVPFEPDAMLYLPAHWFKFTGRASRAKSLGYANASNRHALDITNAMLNYSYSVCMSEAIIACLMFSLDPGIGIAHGIHDGKPGMALDLMEPLRPIADRVVLSMLDCGNGIPLGADGKPAYLSARSCFETGDGTCRLYAPLTHQLASQVSMAVAPHAVKYAQMIARKLSATEKIRLTVPFDPRIREVKRPAMIDQSCKPEILVPDAMWQEVRALIPVRKHPAIATDTRAVLAGIVAHEIYGCSWTGIPASLSVDWRTCRARLAQWERSGVWEKIESVVTRPGVSAPQLG